MVSSEATASDRSKVSKGEPLKPMSSQVAPSAMSTLGDYFEFTKFDFWAPDFTKSNFRVLTYEFDSAGIISD